MEFSLDVECPHCEHANNYRVTFPEDVSQKFGGESLLTPAECFHCDKDFWFTAIVRIELDVSKTYRKKPKT
jgi:hypothetical protein